MGREGGRRLVLPAAPLPRAPTSRGQLGAVPPLASTPALEQDIWARGCAAHCWQFTIQCLQPV